MGLSLNSAIGWIDFDEAERDRAQRLMDLFKEQDSRDELGLGAIRDSISDHLFPGTSTIHTRLRYMLFIPWIFQSLPVRLNPREITKQANFREIQLIGALTTGAPGAVGIIGRQAGKDLQRLPSSIYWSALESWGIRQFPGSIDSYFTALSNTTAAEGRDHVGDDFGAGQRHRAFWNERLPQPPEDWLEGIDFDLQPDEVSFLVDRLVDRHPNSLLTFLANRDDRPQADAIWLHPHIADFPAQVKILVEHARIFSCVIHGAALLYNLLLSERRNKQEWIDHYSEALRLWNDELNYDELACWSLTDFWHETQHSGHQVQEPARRFVAEWVSLLRSKSGLEGNKDAASRLVINREMKLKKGQSRFANKGALNRWGGASGTVRLQYRWPIAHSLLRDLKP